MLGLIAPILVGAICLLMTGAPAHAETVIDDGDLAACAAITRKEQLVLERRALGGDQRAQFMLAYCAWKSDVADTTREKQITYAYFWVTLANCERRYDDLNKPIETLEDTDIPSVYKRYKKPRDLRREYEALLMREAAELQRIKAEVEDSISSEPLDLIATPFDLRQSVSLQIVSSLKAMGKSGLVPLAMMRNCIAYPGFQQRYVRAGLWKQIKQDAKNAFWINDEDTSPKLNALADEATQDLGKDELLEIDRFTQAYAIGDLESQAWQGAAALGRMGQVPVEAVQFALGAFRRSPTFPEGIAMGEVLKVDGLYGPQTSSLTKAAQINPCIIRDVAVFEDTFKYREASREEIDGRDCFGTAHPKDEGTGWLTPRQSRTLICRAAVKQNDPFSYMHLGYMFINGFGYGEDIDRALFAVQRAIQLFSDPSMKLQLVKSPSFPSDRALINHYLAIAENLEQAIYWAAAENFFGSTRPNDNSPITPQLKESIHRRLPRANYDGRGLLCPDELIQYFQSQLRQEATRDRAAEFAILESQNMPELPFGSLPQTTFPLSVTATTQVPLIGATPFRPLTPAHSPSSKTE